MSEAMHTSPLNDQHVALGARLTEFGGWHMPIQYASVLEEHRACRSDAAVFDVSHLGSALVHGDGALDALQRTFTNDLGRIGPGRAQYTNLLDADDAHVVDDVIVWWTTDDEFVVMPNASNTERLVGALRDEGAPGCRDITTARAVLAVQGPHARRRLETVSAEIASVPRFHVRAVRWNGHDCIAAGTGYTGEDGVEVHVPASGAADLWQAILDTGVAPAGLGARDTLRLEAGLPLHGHELGPGITPLQARLGWVVGWDKGPFRGREPLARERERGVARVLTGLAVAGRRPPREGYAVRADAKPAGVVTSGNFSPTLGHGIALAFVATDVDDEAPLTVEMRGEQVAAERVRLPFVRAGEHAT
ncbi:MAG TPA: glycine cleavage system aminomethyltransferase GcvT [Acidimicrobiia bacterium]